MKYIKPYNESIRDKMEPKSDDDVMSAIMNLTPHAMQYQINNPIDLDVKLFNKLQKIAEDRIDEAQEELDDIFKSYDGDRQVQTYDLMIDVVKWVDKNGGNKENLLKYGLNDFSAQMQDSFLGYHRHDWGALYSFDSVHLFHKLLKQLAMDEISINNQESIKLSGGL